MACNIIGSVKILKLPVGNICKKKYKTDDGEVLDKTPIGWYNLTLFSEGQKDDNNVTLEDV